MRDDSRRFQPLFATLAGSAAALALAGCQKGGTNCGSETMTVRTYAVSPVSATETVSALNGLLKAKTVEGKDDKQVQVTPERGRAQLAAGNQILVAAPETYHQGIEEFMKKLETLGSQVPPRVRTDVWAIGRFGSDKNIRTGEWSPELEALGEKLMGGHKSACLAVLEHASLQGMTATRLNTYGNKLSFKITSVVVEKTIVSDFMFRFSKIDGETRLKSVSNDTMIVAQNGFPMKAISEEDAKGCGIEDTKSDASVDVFLVVRSAIEETKNP